MSGERAHAHLRGELEALLGELRLHLLSHRLRRIVRRLVPPPLRRGHARLPLPAPRSEACAAPASAATAKSARTQRTRPSLLHDRRMEPVETGAAAAAALQTALDEAEDATYRDNVTAEAMKGYEALYRAAPSLRRRADRA